MKAIKSYDYLNDEGIECPFGSEMLFLLTVLECVLLFLN